MTELDFKNQSIQVSGFTSGEANLYPTPLLKRFPRKWASEYDGDTVSLPLPPEIPDDVPRVMLSNKSGTSRLELTSKRINLIRIAGDEAELELEATSKALADELVAGFKVEEAEFGRIGLVAIRVTSVDSPAGLAIAKHFFQPRWLKAPLNRPESLEIHAHKVFGLKPDLLVNSWVRVKSGSLTSTGDPLIVVEQDINTLENDRSERIFSPSDCKLFFSTAAREMEKILKLYFPADQDLQTGSRGEQ